MKRVQVTYLTVDDGVLCTVHPGTQVWVLLIRRHDDDDDDDDSSGTWTLHLLVPTNET